MTRIVAAIIVIVSTEMKTFEQALADLKEIAEYDKELAGIPLAKDDNRTYSISQIIQEIENGTEIGKRLVANYIAACGGEPK